MDTSNLLAFTAFATIAAFTPGPNNLMLATSGANFGIIRTLPHIAGVITGFLILVIFGSFGLTSLFSALPMLLEVARILAFLFLLYLMKKIATAQPAEGVEATAQPIGFLTAMLFQLVNPKGLFVITAAVTIYVGEAERLYFAIFFITVVFTIVNILSTLLWTYAGSLISRLLTNKNHLRLFNYVMAAILGISLLPVIINL